MFAKIRPQVALAIFGLTMLGLYALYQDTLEVATLAGGGLVGLGMNILEKD